MVRKLIGADTCECLGYLCTGLKFRKGGAGSARSGSQGQDDYCYCTPTVHNPECWSNVCIPSVPYVDRTCWTDRSLAVTRDVSASLEHTTNYYRNEAIITNMFNCKLWVETIEWHPGSFNGSFVFFVHDFITWHDPYSIYNIVIHDMQIVRQNILMAGVMPR